MLIGLYHGSAPAIDCTSPLPIAVAAHLRPCRLAIDMNGMLETQLARAAVESADRDNKRALARKVVIEERKEKAERAALAAEQEEADRRLLQQRINDSVEEQRRKDEMCVPLLLAPPQQGPGTPQHQMPSHAAVHPLCAAERGVQKPVHLAPKVALGFAFEDLHAIPVHVMLVRVMLLSEPGCWPFLQAEARDGAHQAGDRAAGDGGGAGAGQGLGQGQGRQDQGALPAYCRCTVGLDLGSRSCRARAAAWFQFTGGNGRLQSSCIVGSPHLAGQRQLLCRPWHSSVSGA